MPYFRFPPKLGGFNAAAPGPIGGTTPGTGAFTTLAASSTTNTGRNVMTPEAIAPDLNGAGTCSVAVTTTGFVMNGNNALSLDDGVNGQIKAIVCTAVTAAGTATLTPTTKTGFTTVGFAVAGESVVLQFFTGAGWCCLGAFGAIPS